MGGPCRWIFRGCDRRIFARSAPECSPSSDTAMNYFIGPCSDGLASQPAQRDPSTTWAYRIGCIVPALHGHTAQVVLIAEVRSAWICFHFHQGAVACGIAHFEGPE